MKSEKNRKLVRRILRKIYAIFFIIGFISSIASISIVLITLLRHPECYCTTYSNFVPLEEVFPTLYKVMVTFFCFDFISLSICISIYKLLTSKKSKRR